MINSGDTAGDKERVVGYGAYHFTATQDEVGVFMYKDNLLDIARQSIAHGLQRQVPIEVDVSSFPPSLQAIRGSFVSLNIAGKLRGCIGSLEAHLPLVTDLANNAFKAAFNDPRFPPVTLDEFAQLEIHLSLLNKPELIVFDDEQDLLQQLRPEVDGVILEAEGHRGTFLPFVWQQLKTPEEFFRSLKGKAGLPENYWSDSLRVWRYTVDYL